MSARSAFSAPVAPCANGFPGCGRTTGGYNPLGLCAACHEKYLRACGSPHRVGEGEPARRLQPRPCPRGCAPGDYCAAAKVVRRGDWIYVTPGPQPCARASL